MGSNPTGPASDYEASTKYEGKYKSYGEQNRGREKIQRKLASATNSKPREIESRRKALPASTKKAAMLRDPQVRRWFENLSRGSPITAEVAVRRLSKFCEDNRTNPKRLVSLGPKKSFELVCDAVTRLEREEKAPLYILGITKAVKSWLRFNSIRFDDKVKITNATQTKLREKVPSPKEVEQIVAAGDLRSKVAVCLLAYSGLRPESLGDFQGRDGLTLSDLPELSLPDLRFEGEPPFRIVIRPSISKANHEYFSFLNEKTVNVIIAYLRERIERGERLSGSSVLVRPTAGKKRDGSFVCTINISDIIRRTIRRAGFSWRPYILRAFFDTQLLIAENQGAIAHDYRVFFMGHKGSIEATYTLNKGLLPDELLEDLKEGYSRASSYLSETKADLRLKSLEESVEQKIEKAREETRKEYEAKVESLIEKKVNEILARANLQFGMIASDRITTLKEYEAARKEEAEVLKPLTERGLLDEN